MSEPIAETDLVLSAIRRGEETVPKIKQATGIDYARLTVVLHDLEFNWKSIDKKETAEGFARYYPASTEEALSPKPWCIRCRNQCHRLGYTAAGESRWRCGKCKEVFTGSREAKRPAPKPKPKPEPAPVAYIIESETPAPVKKAAARRPDKEPRDIQQEQELL